MTHFDYDLFVIGGGSGGVRAARIAAAEGGARVGLAEESRMGGTCVIRGCVPKKLMVYASEYPGQIADARAYGWDVQANGFDWGRCRTTLEAELTLLENAYRGTLKNAGITIHYAYATVLHA
ncbi:MAG: NADPH-glutathione reductase, partial [Pseudorhodobacter sp.]